MDSILSCMTAGHNIYTINRERKQLFLTHKGGETMRVKVRSV